MDTVEVIVQTPPMLNWAAGVMAIMLVTLVARIEMLHSHIIKGLDRQTELLSTLRNLETMHEHPDDYNFGTQNTNRMVTTLMHNCQEVCNRHGRVLDAVERLTSVIAYEHEERTGKKLPPLPLMRPDDPRE
jgi:hypothetical protein